MLEVIFEHLFHLIRQMGLVRSREAPIQYTLGFVEYPSTRRMQDIVE
jgi:hypothetical protein